MPEHNSYCAAQESVSSPRTKRLGGYLVEAGLLTPAQVDVVLNDQKSTGMRFGEILAARGWVKQQTIEYFMQKVILPEQQLGQRRSLEAAAKEVSSGKEIEGVTPTPRSDWHSVNGAARRDLPITKPLPSMSAADDDVSWVG
jgi:hypothetical protein